MDLQTLLNQKQDHDYGYMRRTQQDRTLFGKNNPAACKSPGLHNGRYHGIILSLLTERQARKMRHILSDNCHHFSKHPSKSCWTVARNDMIGTATFVTCNPA